MKITQVFEFLEKPLRVPQYLGKVGEYCLTLSRYWGNIVEWMESLCLLVNDEVEVEGKRGDYSHFCAIFSWQERWGERNPRLANGWLKEIPVARFASGWSFPPFSFFLFFVFVFMFLFREVSKSFKELMVRYYLINFRDMGPWFTSFLSPVIRKVDC